MTWKNRHPQREGDKNDPTNITPFEMGLWRLNQRMLPWFGTITVGLLGFVAVQIWNDHDKLTRLEAHMEMVDRALGLDHRKDTARK